MSELKRVIISGVIVVAIFAALQFFGIFNAISFFIDGLSGNFGIEVEDMVYFRYAILALGAAAIFYVLSTAGIPHNKGLQAILSLAIGSLMMFIKLEELYSVFQSYVALLFALILGILFFVVYMTVRKVWPPKGGDELAEPPEF